jgi:uncharacterized membrane protein YgcG
MSVRRWTLLISLLIVGLIAVLTTIFVQRPATQAMPPAPIHYLDDQAGLLSAQFVAAKEQYLEYLSRTMRVAQISIVILPRLPSGEMEDFTIRAASTWKIGSGGADNGLILFIFRDDRKLRLEVGYGLESVITDVLAHRLLEEQLVPAFSRGQFETGIEDFLDVLNKTLESSEAASHRAAPYAEMLPFVLNVLKSSPRVGLEVWRTFVAADTEGRIVLSLFAAVFFGLFAWALIGIAAGVPALLMLPWRLYSSQVLRTIGTAAVREQFSAKNFIARPPPFFKSLFVELQLAAVVNSIYLSVAIVVGIAFLFVGSSALIGGLGHYGGGGASLSWGAL